MTDTGRFYVQSMRTGKVYCVEPIDAHTPEWGSVDPSTGELTHKKGWLKHTGGIKEKDSIITSKNGFKNIKDLAPGVSPLDEIEKIDAKYPSKCRCDNGNPCNGEIKFREIYQNQLRAYLCEYHYEHMLKVGEWYKKAMNNE